MKHPRMSDDKKSGGRPSTGAGTLISQSWRDRDLAAIDGWRARQPDQPTRAEAICRLVELGLSVGRTGSRNRAAEAAARKMAREMAAAQVDSLTDPSLPEEERRRRKRRLIRRPKELRRRQGERTKPKV